VMIKIRVHNLVVCDNSGVEEKVLG